MRSYRAVAPLQVTLDIGSSISRHPMPDTPRGPVYDPQPMDAPGVSIPAELVPLLERLAENTHAVWARQRISEGWTYGPTRDDAAKRHPDLVPYDQLVEGEKMYDRRTASETLRAILAWGYRVVPPTPTSHRGEHEMALAARTSPAQSPFDAGAPLAVVASKETTIRQLLDLWNGHRDEDWVTHPELYVRFAKRLIQLGEPLLARDVLQIARAARPDDRRLRHLNGLALARSGATQLAHMEATALANELGEPFDHTSRALYEDVAGLVGRTAKDLALDTEDPDARRNYLERSSEAYERAYRVTGGSYSGINAAAMALLAGNRDRAAVVAREVRSLVQVELAGDTLEDESRYWHLATLGEAALLLGEDEEARACYGDAQHASGRIAPGDVGSTRRQARLILTQRGQPTDWIDEVLPAPVVVLFAGHRMDELGRASERFPPRAERVVRDEIARRLPANARVGFSGAADGADILFQEVARERGAETYIVLPFGEQEFTQTSVAPEWLERFQRVKAAASECVITTGQRSVDERLLFDYAHQISLGLAAIHARWIDARLVVLVLWDGVRGKQLHGTAAAVARWRQVGHHVDVIDLRALVARADAASAGTDHER